MRSFIPIAAEGLLFIIPVLIPFLIFTLIGNYPLALLFGFITLCIALFFRDPERKVIKDDSLILSPADGKIIEVSGKNDAKENDLALSRVSIFMSVLNCHINRIPLSGKVTDIEYNPGKFLLAFREKASELNEQNTVKLSRDGLEVGIRQIAGLVARRIVCRIKKGDNVIQGERFGLIRFGSRVDLILPSNIEILVKPGQKVKAGVSIIAKIKTLT